MHTIPNKKYRSIPQWRYMNVNLTGPQNHSGVMVQGDKIPFPEV
ncbi:MAG: hypothetical protein ACRD6U_06845 [Nitrososphaeraceae archaeon]